MREVTSERRETPGSGPWQSERTGACRRRVAVGGTSTCAGGSAAEPPSRAAPGAARRTGLCLCSPPPLWVLWTPLSLVAGVRVGSAPLRPPPVSRARSTSSASLGRVAKPSPARAAACAGVPFLRATALRPSPCLTTRTSDMGHGDNGSTDPPRTSEQPARAGRNGSSSVRRSVYHVRYEKYISKVFRNNNRAGGRPNVCSFADLGQVRDPRRTSDHQMSGCLPYAGWLATPPSLQHLAVAW